MRDSIEVKPSEYKLSAKPNSEQFRRLERSIQKNLGSFTCLIPGASTAGWKWTITNDRQWKDDYYEEEGVDLTDPDEVEAADDNLAIEAPPLPTIKNPHLFKILTTWSDKQINIEPEEYNKKVYIYLTAANMQKATLLDRRGKIQSSITAELTNENGDFKTNTTIRIVIKHLTRKFIK